jgi:hypothetical protein
MRKPHTKLKTTSEKPHRAYVERRFTAPSKTAIKTAIGQVPEAGNIG